MLIQVTTKGKANQIYFDKLEYLVLKHKYLQYYDMMKRVRIIYKYVLNLIHHI
jgi:hypothetical protein